jgi:hypothetical protein
MTNDVSRWVVFSVMCTVLAIRAPTMIRRQAQRPRASKSIGAFGQCPQVVE